MQGRTCAKRSTESNGQAGGAAMSRNSTLTIGIATIWLAGVLAISAQDKYAVKVPNGLPFSDFKGYEDWQIVAVSQTDVLQDVFLIEKDSKKYPNTKGWAYAVFDYDRAADSFVPNKTGTINCGFACHTRVANKDYIFTAYGKR